MTQSPISLKPVCLDDVDLREPTYVPDFPYISTDSDSDLIFGS